MTGQGYAPDLSDEEVDESVGTRFSSPTLSVLLADSRHDRGLEAEEKAREPPHS